MNQQYRVYAIQMDGIKCTACSRKINSTLTQIDGLIKSNVDVLQQKLYVTLHNAQIQDVIGCLATLKNFKMIASPILLNTNNQHRKLCVKNFDGVIPKVEQIAGLISVKKKVQNDQLFIQYRPEIIKGTQIQDIFMSNKCQYEVYSQRVQGLSLKQKIQNKPKQLYIAIVICFLFITLDLILPNIPHMQKFIEFPIQFGVFSIFLIINILMTFVTLILFGCKCYKQALSIFIDHRELSMVTLIALGSSSSLFLSIFQLTICLSQEQAYIHCQKEISSSLLSTSLILCIIRIGKYFQQLAKEKINKITQQIFPEKELFKNLDVIHIDIVSKDLKYDQRKTSVVLIQKGELIILQNNKRLLLDVEILQGQVQAIDSIITGNDSVQKYTKGSILMSGSLIINSNRAIAQAKSTFQQSNLLQIGNELMLRKTRDSTSIEVLCQKIAQKFVKCIIALAICVIIVWTILIYENVVNFDEKMCKICFIVQKGVGILVVSCPCALGLAIPSVISIILNISTKKSILLRTNKLFEDFKKIKTIAFDKTGTLFTRVKNIENYSVQNKKYSQQLLWQIVALLQKDIVHPLGFVLYKQGLQRTKDKANYNFMLYSKPKLQSKGISCTIIQKKKKKQIKVLLGNKELMQQNNIETPITLNKSKNTQILLAVQNIICLLIQLNTHSNLRPQAQQVIQQLKRMQKQVFILSGDAQQSVDVIANMFDIKGIANVTAQEKKCWIQSKQGVMMIGDGLNDILGLQNATIGVSINAKSELNLQAASVIILGQNLGKIVSFFKLMNKADFHIKLNLFWAFIYNIVMLPIVAGVLYNWSVQVSPFWASVAMSCSSLIVLGCSHLLMCYEYDFKRVIIRQDQKESMLLQLQQKPNEFKTLIN